MCHHLGLVRCLLLELVVVLPIVAAESIVVAAVAVAQTIIVATTIFTFVVPLRDIGRGILSSNLDG